MSTNYGQKVWLPEVEAWKVVCWCIPTDCITTEPPPAGEVQGVQAVQAVRYHTPWAKSPVVVGEVVEAETKESYYGFHAYMTRDNARAAIQRYYDTYSWLGDQTGKLHTHYNGRNRPALARVTLFDVFEEGKDGSGIWGSFANTPLVWVANRMRVEEVLRTSSIGYGPQSRLAVVD